MTDKIYAKLNEQKIETGTVSSEERYPGWTRWAGAAAGIFLGNPAGAALVGFGALDWKSLIGQFLTAVGANIFLLYGGGTFLGPIGIALAGLVAGAVQLRLARNKLVKLTKEKMKESLPNVAKAERIKVYNFVKEIFNNFENEVTQRIDSDISSRKLELEELLAQKASQEIDKTAEVSRLNTLDSHIFTQWNAVEAITDKLLEETV